MIFLWITVALVGAAGLSFAVLVIAGRSANLMIALPRLLELELVRRGVRKGTVPPDCLIELCSGADAPIELTGRDTANARAEAVRSVEITAYIVAGILNGVTEPGLTDHYEEALRRYRVIA